MAAHEHLHPDLFGGVGAYPPARADRSADVAGPTHGPAEPPVHGPAKPRTAQAIEQHQLDNKATRGKAFSFGQSEPDQLTLFAGARDIKASINESHDLSLVSEHASHYGLSSSGDDDGYYAGEEETMDEMWGRKLAESKMSPDSGVHGAGVHASILKEGYRPHESVTLHYADDPEWGGAEVRVHDAHHRIAAAADIEETEGRNVWIRTHHEDPDINMRLRLGRARPQPAAPDLNPSRTARFKEFSGEM